MTRRAVFNMGSEGDALAVLQIRFRLFFATCVILMADALVYRDGDGPGWKAA